MSPTLRYSTFLWEKVDVVVTSSLHLEAWRIINDHIPPLPRKRLLPSARRTLQRTWSTTLTPPPFWEAPLSQFQRGNGKGWSWFLQFPSWRVEDCGQRHSHITSRGERGMGGHGLDPFLLEKWMGCPPIHFSRRTMWRPWPPAPLFPLEARWNCLRPHSSTLPERN